MPTPTVPQTITAVADETGRNSFGLDSLDSLLLVRTQVHLLWG